MGALKASKIIRTIYMSIHRSIVRIDVDLSDFTGTNQTSTFRSVVGRQITYNSWHVFMFSTYWISPVMSVYSYNTSAHHTPHQTTPQTTRTDLIFPRCLFICPVIFGSIIVNSVDCSVLKIDGYPWNSSQWCDMWFWLDRSLRQQGSWARPVRKLPLKMMGFFDICR